MDLVDFFSGLDTNDNFHDARVDPFEPRRVWITSTPSTKVVGPLSCFGAKVNEVNQLSAKECHATTTEGRKNERERNE